MKKLVLITLLALAALPVFAQRQLSADVETKQVAEGKVTTTRKHVCCLSSGRLVSFYTYPKKYYTIETPKGEAQIYIPDTKEVMTDHSGSAQSNDDLLYLFLSGGLNDMGLIQFGYKFKTQSVDKDGYLKKTFTTTKANEAPVVEVVYKNYLPVYIAYKSTDGFIRGKQYLSNYVTLGRLSFPSRTTEIMYPNKKDSVVIRTIYSNLGADKQDALSTFQVPSDAKPVKVDISKAVAATKSTSKKK